MSLVQEDDVASDIVAPDFSDLLDLPDIAFSGAEDVTIGTTLPQDPLRPFSPSQLGPLDSLHNDYMGDWNLPAPIVDPYLGIEEPDYAKFENWIPEFIRPEKPCDYCRIKRLNCYITRGEHACTACSTLFRDCSLTNTRTLEAANQSTGYLLDTLHVVDEDAVREQGSVTGIKPLRSKARASGSSTPVRLDDAPGSSKRNGIRFPRHAVKTLRDWLDAHSDWPYPTEEEKVELKKKTELQPSQIDNWLANARRRRKVSDKAKPRFFSSPSLKPTTPAIDIPRPERPEKPWDELNPLQRWQHSPPEHEPASITDIANAVANSELGDDQVSTSPSSFGRRKKRSSNGSGFSNLRAPSTTSLETGQSSSLSATNSAAYSHHSSRSHGSFGSFNSSLAGKRERRRRRKPAQGPVRRLGDEKKRIFQCTFCTDTFKSKYDWTRHEKSLHLSLEKWICAPLGPVITDPATCSKRCVYCDTLDPSADHLEIHNHRQCDEKGLDARTFYRKDHLRQHLRLMHSCEMTPFMDSWKSIAVNINSRCGFCGQRFTVWQERVDHLTAHFKAGARMSEWKGCRGLDPAVAAQVTNAMPPYLIGVESVSPVPFSASNKATWRHNLPSESGADPAELESQRAENYQNYPFEPETSELIGFGSKATCWEILTVRLGKYANEMAKKGITITDEMLQSKARRILYDSDDAWNQTAADNPEWLDLFKKAHGLNFIPSQIGGQGDQVPEDLETYGDLGLRIPFSVQLKAYNENLENEACFCDAILGPHSTAIHEAKRREDIRALYRILATEGVLHDSNGKCKHTECDDNVLAVIAGDTSGPTQYRWCTYTLSPEKAQEIARLQTQESHALKDGETARIVDLSFPKDAGPATKAPYRRRHRYEMPRNRAGHFETVTGAWQDSGLRPEAVQSTTSTMEQSYSTTTGAMMEFLGGDVGNALPFITDAETSSIPLEANLGDWTIPTTSAQEVAMLEDIDRMIAETTKSHPLSSVPAESYPVATTGMDMSTDLAMQDFTFDDIDLNFDSVFEMPMDESFGPPSGH